MGETLYMFMGSKKWESGWKSFTELFLRTRPGNPDEGAISGSFRESDSYLWTVVSEEFQCYS